jgi:hypothetical protein
MLLRYENLSDIKINFNKYELVPLNLSEIESQTLVRAIRM